VITLSVRPAKNASGGQISKAKCLSPLKFTVLNGLPNHRFSDFSFGVAAGEPGFSARPHEAVTRVYDEASNVIETHEHTGDLNVR